MNNVRKFVEENILPCIETPGQYIGGEWNSITKDHRSVDVTIALAFPDTYAIGMSHLGIQILYGLLNERDDTACERVFAPWSDMEEALRNHDVPLYSLETFTPLRNFDIVGFSIQYEMSYTNVLNMLNLAKIPLRSQERSEDDPLIMAGGPLTLNPEPMADFIDIFFVGEGEERFTHFINHFKSVKHSNGLKRDEIILSLVKQFDNLYAPSLYDVTYEPDDVIREIVPHEATIPSTVQSARVKELDTAYFPKNPIVPYVQTIHDRISIEVMRGCTQGCRFCQAGMTKRPNRIRSVDTIVKLSKECYRNTGHDEISLGALSISDYPHLKELMRRMDTIFNQNRVNISFPSLRISDQLTELPSYLNTVRKSSLTLAPEAATTRLRKVINKEISDEDLFNGVREAFKEGWKLVKLYFMVGLPTETDKDIEAIVELAHKVSSLRKEVKGVYGDVNVTIAPFVPKAHTPFQWGPMVQLERINKIKQLIKSRIRGRKIKIKFNKPERSFLEGVFARGDRRLGSVILEAWSKGCKFDAWDEHFNYHAWTNAFKEVGIDAGFYVYRQRREDEIFPWDHISSGVAKQFFKKENDKSSQQLYTPDCFTDSCPDCGACARSSNYVDKMLSQLT